MALEYNLGTRHGRIDVWYDLGHLSAQTTEGQRALQSIDKLNNVTARLVFRRQPDRYFQVDRRFDLS